MDIMQRNPCHSRFGQVRPRVSGTDARCPSYLHKHGLRAMKSKDIERPEEGDTVTVEIHENTARKLDLLADWREDDTGEELDRGDMVYVAAKFLHGCNPDTDGQLIAKLSAIDVINIQEALQDSVGDIEADIEEAPDLVHDDLQSRKRRVAGTLKAVERQGFEDSAALSEESVMYEYDANE